MRVMIKNDSIRDIMGSNTQWPSIIVNIIFEIPDIMAPLGIQGSIILVIDSSSASYNNQIRPNPIYPDRGSLLYECI